MKEGCENADALSKDFWEEPMSKQQNWMYTAMIGVATLGGACIAVSAERVYRGFMRLVDSVEKISDEMVRAQAQTAVQAAQQETTASRQESDDTKAVPIEIEVLETTPEKRSPKQATVIAEKIGSENDMVAEDVRLEAEQAAEWVSTETERGDADTSLAAVQSLEGDDTEAFDGETIQNETKEREHFPVGNPSTPEEAWEGESPVSVFSLE